jgi:hypothetical protein
MGSYLTSLWSFATSTVRQPTFELDNEQGALVLAIKSLERAYDDSV